MKTLFDGDQMAVHVPFSLEAQAGARLLLFSHTNPLSTAIVDPIALPTQDMLIGRLYVLTNGDPRGICAKQIGIIHAIVEIRKMKEVKLITTSDCDE